MRLWAVRGRTSTRGRNRKGGVHPAGWSSRIALLACGAVLALLALPNRPAAQDTSTYPTVRNPGKFNIDWRRFYDRADALTADARAHLRHHLDLAYGADAKQKLDLYLPPSGEVAGWPVFVFLHGGGFREGDRAHYGFVATPMAASGVLTVVPSYRLYPHRYPDQVEDVRRILSWIRRSIREYGGDSARVYAGGHSAGAILSALAGVKAEWRDSLDLPADFIKGIVPVSGPYDLRYARGFVSDFVSTPREREAASPLLNIQRTPPAIVALGSKEPYLEDSRRFVEELRRHGGDAELIVLEDLGHDGTALAFGDGDGPLVRAVRRMIRSR